MGGGGVGKMRANACKGGGGVLAMSAHAFLALKDLQFGVVLMEGFDPDSVVTTRSIFFQFGHFCSESAPLHKLKKASLLLLVLLSNPDIYPFIVQDIQGSFSLKLV